MKSYYKALDAATLLVNMPNPQAYPSKFIEWSEDICELIAEIYNKDYGDVVEDLQERLGLLEDNE